MMQRLSKAALAASPNVVRLPTASSRMVDNYRFKEQREAGRRAKNASPFKTRYIDPQVRAKLPDAAALLLVERTPELLLLLAIFESLSMAQQLQIRAQCDLFKHTGAAGRGAAMLVETRTIADSVTLDAALKVLREEARNG